MSAKIDLTGQKFARLTFVKEVGGRVWEVVCDCGTVFTVLYSSVKTGNTSSCGCLKREATVLRNKAGAKEGRQTREYKIWGGIKTRCYNTKAKKYKEYGARGIYMSEEWRNSFDVFYADMGPSPSNKHSIDRIENSKGYERGNCRWATAIEQGNNKTCNVRVTYAGETLTLTQWGERALVRPEIFGNRIRLSKWSFEEALNTPSLPSGVNKRHGLKYIPCMQPYPRPSVILKKAII